MTESKSCTLGIDTSNYTTSIAIVDREGTILCDLRKPLVVKEGERGLRQSEAFFQHIDSLPGLLEQTMNEFRDQIGAVAYSDKPRPVENSYMPVFKAGKSFAVSMAAALGAPSFAFSHQEGHIEAIRFFSQLNEESEFLCFHLSGGTCEVLHVNSKNIQIIGGSRDISLGQVIDRVGVTMGLEFPAGKEMDRMAIFADAPSDSLTPITLDDLYFDLSGLETQCSRLVPLETGKLLCKELFEKIGTLLIELAEKASHKTGLKKILFVGGVSSSVYISKMITNHFTDEPIQIFFGDPSLSKDNAVGIALLGGNNL